jgi:IS5 family transposase
LGVTVLRESDPQPSLWEALLPEELKRLPAELAQVDAYLDDERFITPWRALFDRRLGRPSVPVDTLLRLLYLRHRYQLGYETLCRRSATRSGGGGSAASGWTGPCRTRPPWSSWSAAPVPR